MRSIILALVLFLSADISFSQSLLELNQSELNIELKNSLDKEDYDRAAKIQKEILVLQRVDSLKGELNNSLKIYLSQENYVKSTEVQSKIEKCVRLEGLPKEIKKALNENNYQQAQAITAEVHTLRFELLGITHNEVNKNVPEVSPEVIPDKKNINPVDTNPTKRKKHRFTFYSGLIITFPKVITDDSLESITGFESIVAAGVSFGVPIGQTGIRLIAGSDVKSFRTVITDDKYPGLTIGEELSRSSQFAYHFGIDYSIVLNRITISPGVIIDRGVVFEAETPSTFISYYGPNIIGEPGLNYERNNVQPQITIQYNNKNIGVYAKYRHGTSILNPEYDVSKSRFYLSCLELGITIKRK